MAQGYFMEALMDFSVAIKLEKDRIKIQQEKEAMNSLASKKEEKLQEYYRNAGQANFELAQFNEAL